MRNSVVIKFTLGEEFVHCKIENEKVINKAPKLKENLEMFLGQICESVPGLADMIINHSLDSRQDSMVGIGKRLAYRMDEIAARNDETNCISPLNGRCSGAHDE